MSDEPMPDAPVADRPNRGGRPKGWRKPTPPVFQMTPDVIAALTSAIAKTQAATDPSQRYAAAPASHELTALIEALKLSAEANKTIGEQTKRTVRFSNAKDRQENPFGWPDGRGGFHPQNPDIDGAKEKPRLKRLTYFVTRQWPDQLTPAEIELFNSLDTSREARKGRWKALIKQNGTTEELHVIVPCSTSDDMINLPPLVQVLGELCYGAQVADPSQAMALIADLQRQVAALKAAQAGSAA